MCPANYIYTTSFPIVYFSLLDNICLDKDGYRKQSLEIWCWTYLMVNDSVINTPNLNILIIASSWGQDHDGNVVFLISPNRLKTTRIAK